MIRPRPRWRYSDGSFGACSSPPRWISPWRRGRRLIIGPNGAGKTTLFNLVTGELRPDGGTVTLFGRDITRTPGWHRAHLGISRTYQIITLFPRETLLRNVTLSLLGRSPLRWNPVARLERQAALVGRAREALARVGLEHLAERPLSQTSYGERRRVEIAMALAQDPRVLLLDEPFAGSPSRTRRPAAGDAPREVAIVMISDMTWRGLRRADHRAALRPRGGRGAQQVVAPRFGDLSWRVTRWAPRHRGVLR
jgi:ABC-type uncharacterized transport system YnjBCD ATPase subunit